MPIAKKNGTNKGTTSATKIYFFKGDVKYIHLDTPDTAYEPRYAVSVILDKEGQTTLGDSGLSLGLKEDEDGNKFTTFSRKVDDPYKPGRPRIIDGEEVPVDPSTIGRGSTVVACVEVYPLKRYSGMGHRLLAVQVLKLEERTDGAEVVDSKYAFSASA